MKANLAYRIHCNRIGSGRQQESGLIKNSMMVPSSGEVWYY
jgi:hypothetical protein